MKVAIEVFSNRNVVSLRKYNVSVGKMLAEQYGLALQYATKAVCPKQELREVLAHVVTVERCFNMWRVIFVYAAKQCCHNAKSKFFISGKACVVAFNQRASFVAIISQFLTPRLVRLARQHYVPL